MAEKPKNENFFGRIVDTETRTDDNGKKYTAYKLSVLPPWFFGEGPRTIYRRFREFRLLKSSLAKTFGKDVLRGRFPVPPRKPFGKLKPQVIQQRTEALQQFLLDIKGDSDVGMHKLIQDFFEVRQGDSSGPKAGDRDEMQKVAQGPKVEGPGKNVVVAGQMSKGAAKAVAAAAVPNATLGRPPPSRSKPPAQQENNVPKKKRQQEKPSPKPSPQKQAQKQTPTHPTPPAAPVVQSSNGDSAPKPQKPEESNEKTSYTKPKPAKDLGPLNVPDDIQIYTDKASDSLTAGQFGEAINHYSTALDKCKASGGDAAVLVFILNCRAKCRLNTGEARQAIADCNEVLQLTESHKDAFYIRAQAYEQKESLREAFLDYQRAVQLGEQEARRRWQQVRSMLERLSPADAGWVRRNRAI
eukprot:m.134903 g.134903  ORF g.134903 m.134903 type:complete len:412 (+) comp14706_c0_seq1:217-1452(+)